jgi:hypothetical protein
MLNSQTALAYVEQIEAIRTQAGKDEAKVLADLREQPDYEQNQDKDLLTAIDLRADARRALEDADTLLGSFDWTYDEAAGKNVRKADPE